MSSLTMCWQLHGFIDFRYLEAPVIFTETPRLVVRVFFCKSTPQRGIAHDKEADPGQSLVQPSEFWSQACVEQP